MTNPAETDQQPESERPPYLVVAPFYKDPATGALYVHRDLEERAKAWNEEEHIGPVEASERLGDVESFTAYVTEHGTAAAPFITWNSQGLAAVLDYHNPDQPGRTQWTAFYPFERTPEWHAWTALANGEARPHVKVVEFFEDHLDDIDTPDKLQLLEILRQIRGVANAEVETQVRPDGTAHIESTTDRRVSVELPAEIRLAIPILKGHTRVVHNDNGDVEVPVLQELTVKVRASVDGNAHLTFRFAIPYAERALERAYADRVAKAKELLGDGFTVLRAAG